MFRKIFYWLLGVVLFSLSACYLDEGKEDKAFVRLMMDYGQNLDTLGLIGFSPTYQKNIENIETLERLTTQESFFHTYVRRLEAIDRFSLSDSLVSYYSILDFEVHLQLERIGLERNHLEKYGERKLLNSGIYYVPNGKSWYRYFVKKNLNSNLSPEALMVLGEREVERSQSTIKRLQKELGFRNDSIAFYEHLKEDFLKVNKAEKVQSLLGSRRGIVSKKLDTYFPIESCDYPKVRRYTKEDDYITVSFDESRQRLRVNPNLKNLNKRLLDALYLKEGVPGKYYKHCINEDRVIRYDFLNNLEHRVYEEGWAAYVISFGSELGLYRTLYDEIGLAELNLIQAVEMVVDIGVNYLGWSDEKAKTYWRSEVYHLEGLSDQRLRNIKQKPGGSLLFHYGKSQILRLKNKKEQDLGEEFDLLKFHQQLLNKPFLF